MANQFIFKRKEIKYLMNERQYQAFMEKIKDMAKVDDYGETTILNIYFDTPDYRLIRTSMEKPVYKEKLRLRSYGVPTDETNSFIEIKKKYKGIVYKRRVSAPYGEAKAYLYKDVPLKETSQISKEIDYFKSCYPRLRPAMAIGYDRIALCGTEDENLRITIDKNLRWRTDRLDLKYGNIGNDILEPGMYLMEIKISNAFDLKLSAILDELEIRHASFSKYGKGYQMLLAKNLQGRGADVIYHPAGQERQWAIA